MGVNSLQIIVDAMGGDNAPYEIVKGAIQAVKSNESIKVVLVGDSERIKKIINEQGCRETLFEIIHTSEVILNEDAPTKAIKSKKDSSMVVGLNMLKNNRECAFISAGNTGALMTGSLLILGRIKGVDRPALAPVYTTKKGLSMLIDAGLNTTCKPLNYLQFGIIGSIYMKEVMGIENPKVGLINVGTEENKGNDLLKQAFSLLSNAGINFVGNVEARQLLLGDVEVAVCDGLVGNVALKASEGALKFMIDELKEIFGKNLITKLAAMTVYKGLRQLKEKFDYERYGGTPILGVDGVVFKCHGGAKAETIKNAVIQADNFVKKSVMEKITKRFENMEVDDED